MGNYCLNLLTSEFLSSKSLWTNFFPQKNPLYESHWRIFHWQVVTTRTYEGNFVQKWSTSCDFFFPLQILSNVVSLTYELPASPCFLNKRRERERALEVDLSRLSSFYLKPAILPPTYDQFMLPSRQQCRSFFRPATNIALSSLTHNSCSRSFTLPRLLTPAQASPPSIPGLWVLLVVMLPLIGVMLPSRKSFVSYFLELITKPHELLLHIGPPCISLKD